MALSSKLKLGFIDESQVKPADSSPHTILWKRGNDLVSSWIFNSVSHEIKKSIVYITTAKQIWEELATRYSQNNVPRLFNLRKDLALLTQGTMSITAYFTKFRGLMDESENLAPIPKCICANNSCACGVANKIEQYERQIHLSQFLMGLNDTFTSTRGHILLMKPLLDLSQAYAMLLQEESQRDYVTHITVTSNHAAKNAKFSTSSTPPKNKISSKKDDKKNSDAVCDYCKFTGHTRDKCFALNGYPEWHRLYGQPKPKIKVQNVKKSAVNSPNATSEVTVSTDSNVTSSLSEAQCQQIIQMLQAQLKTPVNTNAPWINNVTGDTSAGIPYFTNSVMFTSQVHFAQSDMHWILDSGATHHITPFIHLVHNARSVHSDLNLPNGESCLVTHIGEVHLASDFILTDVLVVPTFQCNLLSIPKFLLNTNDTVIFSSAQCILQDSAMRMGKEIGNLVDGLYKLSATQLASNLASTTTVLSNTVHSTSVSQWHSRLGHPSLNVLTHIPGLVKSKFVLSDCETCHLAKQVRLPFPVRESRSSVVFDIINCDVWGPYRHTTHGHCNQILTIVDDYSKCTWLFLCSAKTQIPQLLKDFIAFVKTQFHKTTKIIRSDNGSEFINHDLQSHLLQLGIVQQLTCSHTPQQNGSAERKHQHLLNVARALRFQSHLPIHFGGDCVLTATHLINILPTPVLNYRSPYEVLLQKQPDYSTLRNFGCLCYISNLYDPQDKFGPKSIKCVFLGYPFNKKGYRVMCLQTRKCYVSRDVNFVEDHYPFQHIVTSISDTGSSQYYLSLP